MTDSLHTPDYEPLLVRSMRRADPDREVRIVGGSGTTVRGFLDELDDYIAKQVAAASASGYQTAIDDVKSGAFISGSAYEAVKASFTGKRIATEAVREWQNQRFRDAVQ